MSDAYAVSDDLNLEPTFSPDESAIASDAARTAAIRTARSVTKKTPAALAPVPQISSPEDYEAIPQNTEYLDPDGNLRRKPWQALDAQTYAKIPEGESYSDPQGNVRRKPKYEGVDFTTQTLHDMAVNDKEKRRALERAYPGRVKERPNGELYVEDEDGTLRKPGGGNASWSSIGAHVSAAAAPTVGSVLGTIGGGAVGNFPGAVAGGFTGGAAGQAFNDMIMHLTGVFDRDAWEEGGALMKSGVMGSAGAGVGRGAGLVVGASDAALQTGGQVAPRIAAHVLGADPERLAQAASIAEKGYRVPPSTWAMESPYVHTAVETFDPKFRTQNVLKQDAERYMEDEGGKVLDTLGVPRNFPQGRESLVNPHSAVSSEEAGAALMAKAKQEMVAQDANLARAAENARAFAQLNADTKSVAFKQSVDQLRAAENASMEAAQKAINVGFDNIQSDVNAAMKASEVGANSGELWTGVAQKIQATRNAIVKNAKGRYDRWDDTYGHLVPLDTNDLPELAERVLAQLPEQFQARHPGIVKQMADIAGKVEKKTGERVLADDAEPLTLGQLHNLRSSLRMEVNPYDLTPDVRDGVYKLFSGRVNEVIQSRGGDPLFKEAASVLNDIDAYYGKNMRTFKDRTIQSVVNAIEAGVPADPQLLANTILKEGRTDLTNKVRKMVGPNYWSAVKAADLQEMLDQSKSIAGNIDGRRFVQQVLDRDRSNMLEAVHGKETANRLRTQAQYVAMADGKLDIPTNSGDTIVSLIERAQQAAAAAKAEAAADPLKTLQREMKTIERDFARQQSALRRSRKDDQLGFLYDPTVGATEAADKILKSHDLIFATAARFGEDSSEFNLLRQVYAQRILQGSLKPGNKLEGITTEIQRIMFPGASLDEMQTLAKNMEFLTNSKAFRNDGAGSSIAAQERVLNPWGHITGLGPLAKPLKVIPGMEAGGRYLLTKYYAFLSNLATRPATLQWVARGLNGSQVDREAVKQAINSAMERGGAIGAGVAEGGYQSAPAVDMQPVSREQVMREARPPIPGARRAPDGKHYLPDPQRPGKYLRVD